MLAVELFQLPSPDDSIASLVTFRDRVHYILNQLPTSERPSNSILAKWLFEKLKKCGPLRLVIDRVKEFSAGSDERSYDYLWARLQRVIVESQHDKNLQSMQDGLRKGPRKVNVPGNPGSKGDKGKGKGDKGASKNFAGRGDEKKGQAKGIKGDKGKGKSKGKGKEKIKGANAPGPQGSKDEAGGAQGASGATSSHDGGEKGPCVFYPKGLCRRGDDCPYKPAPKAEPVSVPKAKAGLVALLTAASVM